MQHGFLARGAQTHLVRCDYANCARNSQFAIRARIAPIAFGTHPAFSSPLRDMASAVQSSATISRVLPTDATMPSGAMGTILPAADAHTGDIRRLPHAAG